MCVCEQFRIVSSGTSKGKMLLHDGFGYQYSRKSLKRSSETEYWRCTVRNRSNYCRATVIQRGDIFTRGVHKHNHAPKAGHLQARIISLEVG